MRLAIICIVVLVGVLLAFMEKKTNNNGKKIYDERQQQSLGKANKYAFYTMMIYFAVMVLLELGEITLPIQTSVLYFFGICLGITVQVIFRIIGDAYFGLTENQGRSLKFTVFVGLINIVAGITNISDGRLFENGQISFRIFNLICGIMFVAISIALAIQGRREEEEE